VSEQTKITRRNFLVKGAITVSVASVVGWLFYKKDEKKVIKSSLSGASFKSGHLLRGFNFPEVSAEVKVKWAIVGSGISGLSAARWLQKNGETECILLELESEIGGNSSAGQNESTSYPLGAHYLPVANNSDVDLIDFLHEIGVVEGFNSENQPIYNEFYLCHDPEERLFVKGLWQEGLWPKVGLNKTESKQIERFKVLVEELKHAKGADGKEAFALPLDKSSADSVFRDLDKITFAEYLFKNQFTSPALLWYADYCCRDDYGTSYKETSAWAGLHYFASRKGTAANADSETVVTWPEGNNWLVKQFKSKLKATIAPDTLVYKVEIENEQVDIYCFSPKDRKTSKVVADKCIMATPQFINARLVGGQNARLEAINKYFSYSPWMIANVLLKDLPAQKGKEVCWDNVFYESESLGYVNANHQNLNIHQNRKTWTLYWPLSHKSPKDARLEAINRTEEEWKKMVIKELRQAHFKIENHIEQIDIWLWGHGMIRPIPNFIWGETRQAAQKNIANKVFFANSDLSGISIFEEAFYRGIEAAKQALNSENA
jgi:hypothetical protein